MTQDAQRNFILKLLVASAVSGGLWYSMVGPKLNKLSELGQTHRLQSEEIVDGEEAIRLHSKQVEKSVVQMQNLRDELGEQLDVKNELNVHKHLQDAAESRELTVSRIEPLRESVSIRVSSVDHKKVKIQRQEFRIECVGAYGNIVGYLKDLSQGTNISRVNTFRIVPVSGEYARMILQVDVYQMIDAPDIFNESFHTESTQISDAGVTNDGE